MQKSKIEWCDYTVNPVKGLCPMACDYCYARRMYKRFKWNPEIRFDQTVLFGLPTKSSRVFVGSTIELFGDWVKQEWLETIFTICRQRVEHIFIFLTKQPQNLTQFSPFPSNCQVGATATNQEQYNSALVGLAVIEAKVKYISFEPLLEEISFHPPYGLEGIDWVILGSQTKPEKQPPIGAVNTILNVADIAKVPVFMKNNLAWQYHRQELP